MRLGAFALPAALLACGPLLRAQSFQDEIQVYVQDIQAPGKAGLELHLNRILQAPKDAAPGLPFDGSWNLTPEFSFGLSRGLEVGLYLPAALTADGHGRFAGPKLRLKWLPLRPEGEDAGAFAGLNLELSRANRLFSEVRWEAELRGILGRQGEDWLLALNPVFSWPLSDGQGRGTPDLSTGWKAAFARWKRAAPGLELYLDHGRLDRFDRWREQGRILYATVDVDRAPWVFNIGLGRGLGPGSDRWVLKFIFEVPL